MKLVIDIKDSNVPLFMDIMKSHNNIVKGIKEMKKTKEKRKSRFAKGLAESFNEVKLYEEGKKELKNAKDLINELRSQSH